MTKKARLATAAVVAWFLSLAIMILLHVDGPQPSFMLQSVFHGAHPMAAMWNGMGWMMMFGPIAMLLFFASILIMFSLLARSFSERDQAA